MAPETMAVGRLGLVVAIALLHIAPCMDAAHFSGMRGFVQTLRADSLLRSRRSAPSAQRLFPAVCGRLLPRPAFLHCSRPSRPSFSPISAVLALDQTAEDVSEDEFSDEEDEIDPRTVFIPADENPSETSIFANMGLIPELCAGLDLMKISVPTSIQALSLPLSLAGESVLLCAETGSGKTLAFLLPLVQRIKQDEMTLGITTRPRRPRAIVLVPTRELGQQILHVAKELSKTAKFSSMGIFGGASTAEQAKRLTSPVDLVVGTPGRLTEMVAQGYMSLGDVRFVVADEADTMASQGFGEDLQKLFSGVVGASNACKDSYQRAQELRLKLGREAEASADAGAVTPQEAAAAEAALEAQLKAMRGPFHGSDRGLVQCVLAAATVAEDVKKIMGSTFPRYREVKTAKAHHVPDRVSQEFLPVTPSDKADRLLEAVDRGLRMSAAQWARARELDGARRDATIVFCNTRDSALYVAKLLRESGHADDVAEAHGWVPQSERRGHVADFAAGRRRILVATDIIARGIDTVNVAHVINFDFPLSPVDYLHRVGRTGRGGGTGRVTSLVGKRDATLAVAIEAAARQRRSIENLSSRRTDYVQGRPGLLKSEAPPPRRPAPRPAAAAPPQPAARRSKPKPKDTTMKPYRLAQPKKKRST